MNESLSNPFGISHPTAVQTQLYATALFARFDTTGRFIAAGRATGSVEIWDLETRAPIRILDGHVKAVTCIDWSRNSRYILTSSKDWNVLIWDLASTCLPIQRHASIRLDAPVVSASFHPKNSQIVLTLLATGEAYLCDLRKDHKSRVELAEVQAEEGDEDEDNVNSKRSPVTVARFDPTGKHVWLGTAAGYLLVFNTRTKTMLARHKISGATMMKGIEFTKNCRRLVTNSSDRALRQFMVPTYPSPPPSPPSTTSTTTTTPQPPLPPSFIDNELEPTHKFSDPINRTAWHAMAYSPDGEYLAGGAADPAGHKVYIWDILNDGRLATALDGGKEPLIYVHWHPKKSVLASTSNHGNILIWHHPTPERWGAFAGGFEEVDENVEYEEREDEFDIEDEDAIQLRKMKAEEEEVDIDTMVDLSLSRTSTTQQQQRPNNTGPGGASGGAKSRSSATPVPTATTTTEDAAVGSPMDTSPDNTANANANANANGGAGAGGGEVDLDTAWAEEDPDNDERDKWAMKVLLENEERLGYYY